jgi:hypothetical protein
MNARHLAATPVGQNVRAEAQVIEVEASGSSSRCWRATRSATGPHQRTVIDLRSFNERLAGKGKRCCATASKWCPGAELNHRHSDFQPFYGMVHAVRFSNIFSVKYLTEQIYLF